MTRRFEASSEVSGLDTERILRALTQHQVEYVLVGGLAALAHGSTLATADADLLPRSDPENLDRLLAALEELDAKVLVSEKRMALAAGGTRRRAGGIRCAYPRGSTRGPHRVEGGNAPAEGRGCPA